MILKEIIRLDCNWAACTVDVL